MSIYRKDGVYIERAGYNLYAIGTDEYGNIILVSLPEDDRVIENGDFLRGLAKGVAMRTGKIRHNGSK